MPILLRTYLLTSQFHSQIAHALCSVRHRPYSVSVKIEQHAPAYIGEDYPILIDITNTDDRSLEVTLDVLLQPTEVDDAGRETPYPSICTCS